MLSVGRCMLLLILLLSLLIQNLNEIIQVNKICSGGEKFLNLVFSIPTGAVVGIAISVSVTVALLCIALYLFLRNRRGASSHPTTIDPPFLPSRLNVEPFMSFHSDNADYIYFRKVTRCGSEHINRHSNSCVCPFFLAAKTDYLAI